MSKCSFSGSLCYNRCSDFFLIFLSLYYVLTCYLIMLLLCYFITPNFYESIICFDYLFSENQDLVFSAYLSKFSSYGSFHMIWWEEIYWRYWWQSILLVGKSRVIKKLLRLTEISQNAILQLSSIYLYHTNNWS